MKNIRLKTLRLLNFKGVRDLEIQFNEDVTKIYGRNGSGKTTIFDAFVWVLFGKDSEDRKQFEIKTLDENGVAIPKISHEVTAVLDVDGEEVEVRRSYREKWTKRRGTMQEEFTGNEELRFWNNVPCSVKEFDEKIEALCPESIFKFITNPHYFAAQTAAVQRNLLIEMAGEIDDNDVANGNADFLDLLNGLTGKTMAEYKRELEAQRRRVKTEFDGLPARIDERKQEVATLEAIDYVAVDDEIRKANERVAEIDAILADSSKADEAKVAKKKALLSEIDGLLMEQSNAKMRVMGEVSKGYWKRQEERTALKNEIDTCNLNLKGYKSKVSDLEAKLASLISKRALLIEEYKSIKAETLTIDESDFVCPTCGRRFEVDEIESKQAQITENFNSDKAHRIAENIEKGTKIKQEIEGCTIELNRTKEIIGQWESKLSDAMKALEDAPEVEKPDVDAACQSDEQWVSLAKQIEEKRICVKAMNDEVVNISDTSELRGEKSRLLQSIDENNKVIGQRDNIARNEKRIAELDTQYKALVQTLNDIEKKLFTIAEFGKAKIHAVEDRINHLFEVVKFKMFDTQVNGAVVETCEATIDGVPYSALNNAAQYRAGLDIISAISKYYGLTAPVVIDNSESINEFAPMQSQMIHLYVSEDKSLTIK